MKTTILSFLPTKAKASKIRRPAMYGTALSLLMLTACTQVHDVRVTPYQGDRQAAISFTFDDGMLCHYTDIAPALEQNGFRGTFWIIGANMDREEPGYPWMTWQQVAELSERGHEMSNHSWNHPDLTKLTPEQLAWEVSYCDSVLEAVTGSRPRTFCYPYNAMSPEVVAYCSQNRVGTRTTQQAQGQVESHQTADSLTAWLHRVIGQREWGVTMTHGTTYGWDLWNEPEVLYNFFAEVREASDSVWVAPFADVAAYIEERDHLLLSWTSNGSALVLTPSLNQLDPTLFDQPLTFRIDGTFGDVTPVAQQGTTKLEVKNLGTYLLVDAIPNGEEVIVRW